MRKMKVRGLPTEKINSEVLRLLRGLFDILSELISFNFPKSACYVVAEKNLNRG